MPREQTETPTTIFSCDVDPTIREGDWLRLWNSTGVGVAHDVWVCPGGIVYENSGPGGGGVRRNDINAVLAGRRVIHILKRTAAADFAEKVAFAESKLGALWAAGFYNCRYLASEVATGKRRAFSGTR